MRVMRAFLSFVYKSFFSWRRLDGQMVLGDLNEFLIHVSSQKSKGKGGAGKVSADTVAMYKPVQVILQWISNVSDFLYAQRSSKRFLQRQCWPWFC